MGQVSRFREDPDYFDLAVRHARADDKEVRLAIVDARRLPAVLTKLQELFGERVSAMVEYTLVGDGKTQELFGIPRELRRWLWAECDPKYPWRSGLSVSIVITPTRLYASREYHPRVTRSAPAGDGT